MRDSPENLNNYFYVSLKTEYNSIFLVNYFNSKIGSEILKENRTSGKQMNTLSLEDLKEMIIYIPKLTIQNKIVGSLNITDNLISSLNELKTKILTPKEMPNEKHFIKIKKIEEGIDSLKIGLTTSLFL